MPAVHDHLHRALDAEIDDLGHVSNLRYLAWMQDAAIAHSTALGWPPRRYIEAGAFWVVRSHTIEYLRPAFADDEIVVRTWVAAMGRIDSVRRYRVIRRGDQALLAVGETRWVFVDASMSPRRILPEVAAAFTVVEGEP
ncbi:MAG TPA: acyl-CoA thioesterase [Nannocystaceae bacterium]|nr:acyl-CoA thioesterase [Nannocystaceae bacterium]